MRGSAVTFVFAALLAVVSQNTQKSKSHVGGDAEHDIKPSFLCIVESVVCCCFAASVPRCSFSSTKAPFLFYPSLDYCVYKSSDAT